ncbi:small multidrug efflux protein [Microbacterium aurantiacum]|uniref:Small multidrug efflux protein n=1 Tax=Microbacterium aurantiacum TaxID=162393 RepID=A0AAJ2LVB7_9MICO|nr:small multidrug efflux protein [Microbacterium aurantiacum]MDS0244377.1 small multidrug efflux protein [Microbacterium aurantiacum]
MSASPYQGLQDFVAGFPEFVQPLLVAAIGMIPYVEGEGSAALGILVGINPLVAAIAGAAGNILSVVLVVVFGARARDAVVARRARKAEPARVGAGAGVGGDPADPAAVDPADPAAPAPEAGEKPSRTAKGRRRLSAWLVRFGVPGASLIAPLALPTQLTAAFFVASGVRKGWVILWQVVAIVLWTGLVAAAALGLVTVLGWA